MKKEELIEFLKENLKIEIDTYYRGSDCSGEEGLEVTIYLGNEEISSSRVCTESY